MLQDLVNDYVAGTITRHRENDLVTEITNICRDAAHRSSIPLSGESVINAEDIIQSCLLRVFFYLKRYDKSKSPARSFIMFQVSCGMVDYVRNNISVSRSIAKFIGQINNFKHTFYKQHGYMPSRGMIASELDCDPNKIDDALIGYNYVNMMSLEAAPQHDRGRKAQIVDKDAVDPSNEFTDFPIQLMRHPELTDNERNVLFLRYGEGKEYKDISNITGLTFKTVRVMSSRGIIKLRDKLLWNQHQDPKAPSIQEAGLAS
jgi:RNA polymerase sigma factor (sigma-70 family)